jgi:hypothetical protein
LKDWCGGLRADHARLVNFWLIMTTLCRPQWPRGLRRRSAAAWFLGSQVRIPFGAWMFVCVLCLCVVLSCVGRSLCDGLIPRPG